MMRVPSPSVTFCLRGGPSRTATRLATAAGSPGPDEIPPTLRSDGLEQPHELTSWFDKHLELALRLGHLEQDDAASARGVMPRTWRTVRESLDALKSALHELYRAIRDRRAAALLAPSGATMRTVARLYAWADAVASLLDDARRSRSMVVPYAIAHAGDALACPVGRGHEGAGRILLDIAWALPDVTTDGDLSSRLMTRVEAVLAAAFAVHRAVTDGFRG